MDELRTGRTVLAAEADNVRGRMTGKLRLERALVGSDALQNELRSPLTGGDSGRGLN